MFCIHLPAVSPFFTLACSAPILCHRWILYLELSILILSSWCIKCVFMHLVMELTISGGSLCHVFAALWRRKYFLNHQLVPRFFNLSLCSLVFFCDISNLMYGAFIVYNQDTCVADDRVDTSQQCKAAWFPNLFYSLDVVYKLLNTWLGLELTPMHHYSHLSTLVQGSGIL